MKIQNVLHTESENALTAEQISEITGFPVRRVTLMIEAARRDGCPIVAVSGKTPGYYLTDNAQELTDYCSRLKHREKEIKKTRCALQKVAKEMN